MATGIVNFNTAGRGYLRSAALQINVREDYQTLAQLGAGSAFHPFAPDALQALAANWAGMPAERRKAQRAAERVAERVALVPVDADDELALLMRDIAFGV